MREASALAGYKVLLNRYLFDSNKYTHRCYKIARVISQQQLAEFPFRIGTGSEARGNRGSTKYCRPRALESSDLYAFTRNRDRESTASRFL